MKRKIKKVKRTNKKRFEIYKDTFRHKEFFTIPNFLVIVMVCLLSASVVAEIFIPTYKTNPLLYGLMGTVVGLLIKSMGK